MSIRDQNASPPVLKNIPAMRTLKYFIVLTLILISAGFSYQQQAALAKTQNQLQRIAGSPIDVGFAQFMSVHHDQAIVMAQMLLDGRPTRLEALARSITNTQLLELGQMRGWLHVWDEPALPATRSMDWMYLGDEPPGKELSEYLIACKQSERGMPGLATQTELRELHALDGAPRDLRFLELMLSHHEGGIPMAKFAARHARVAAVRQLAKRIVLAQAEETTNIRMLIAMLNASEKADAGRQAHVN